MVCGAPVAAHRAGVKLSAGLYGVPVPAPAAIVITDSHPMDQDLRQGVKALANTIRAMRPGGVLITLVRAEEGVGVFGLANRKLPLSRGALKRLAPVLVRLVPAAQAPRAWVRRTASSSTSRCRPCAAAGLLCTRQLSRSETQANLPFVEFAPTPEAALAMARQVCPRQADVLVFPHGGITYPILNALP